MSKETEVTRTLQIEDKTIHVHIHLTEEEIRRLLLPHIVDVFASQLRVQAYISPASTTVDREKAR